MTGSNIIVTCAVWLQQAGTRYEQRKGDMAQVAENHTSYRQLGSLGRQRKAGIFRVTGNHTFWGDKSLGVRQKKGGERQESPASAYNLLLIMLLL